jgi:RNA processing factor Prp31
VRILTCVLLFVLCCSPSLRSQSDVPPDPQFHQHRSQVDRDMDTKREKAMNKDRYLRIKRDTDKLLELATELKQYVDKTNENVLSVNVINKADEIDKLAKSIREKMKEHYRLNEGPGIDREP